MSPPDDSSLTRFKGESPAEERLNWGEPVFPLRYQLQRLSKNLSKELQRARGVDASLGLKPRLKVDRTTMVSGWIPFYFSIICFPVYFVFFVFFSPPSETSFGLLVAEAKPLNPVPNRWALRATLFCRMFD